MSTPIIGPNDKRTKITITLPFDANGDAAFDENGKPVGGRTPVEFTVPRFDFMPRPQFREMMKTIDVITKDSDESKSDHDRSYEVILATLRPFVEDAVFAVLEDMPMGVLEQISTDWNEGSSIPLGQLRGSTSSSKSLKGRSTSTSSDTD
jgi:hypothetical protein